MSLRSPNHELRAAPPCVDRCMRQMRLSAKRRSARPTCRSSWRPKKTAPFWKGRRPAWEVGAIPNAAGGRVCTSREAGCPKVFNSAPGHCADGLSCKFCHVLDHPKSVCLDKQQRVFMKNLNDQDKLRLVLPHLQSKASRHECVDVLGQVDLGFHEVSELVQLLQKSVGDSPRNSQRAERKEQIINKASAASTCKSLRPFGRSWSECLFWACWESWRSSCKQGLPRRRYNFCATASEHFAGQNWKPVKRIEKMK